MIRQFFHRILLRRHFWRYATFSEVAELYASRTLRTMAINLSAVLMAVFLYQNGYSILFIGAYFVVHYFLKMLMSFPVIKYISHYGPKHATLLSNMLYIPALIALTFVPEYGLVAMAFTSVLQGASSAIYDLSYLVHFSKVKNTENAGKEIAYMNMFEKVATGLSPLIGGVLAFYAGPAATMWAAAALFMVASVPLFFSPEPVATRRKISFRGFPWRLTWRSLIAETAIGFDWLASGTVWSLLVAIGILGVQGDDVYAKLGALLSVVLLAALAASYAYGRLIDRRRGGDLLKITVIGKSITHAIRPFVGTVGGVAGINIVNEMASTGYGMAFTRGLFDTADISGQRIAYMGLVSFAANVGAFISAIVLCLAVWLVGSEVDGMRVYFVVAAVVVLLIATPKFHLYRK